MQPALRLSRAGAWEWKTIHDTGSIRQGTWATDNTVGLTVNITLMSGSSFQGAANVWTAANLIAVTGTYNGAGNANLRTAVLGFIAVPGIELPSRRLRAIHHAPVRSGACDLRAVLPEVSGCLIIVAATRTNHRLHQLSFHHAIEDNSYYLFCKYHVQQFFRTEC